MAGIIETLLISYCVFSPVLGTDFLERLNTTLRSAAYDELYNDAQEAYTAQKWEEATKYFEQAISDHRQETSVRMHCRLQCRDKFKATTSQNFITDLELDYFRYTIYSHKCTQRCTQKYLGKRLPVSKKIQATFEERQPYAYLQFTYFKVIVLSLFF